jgi:transmembrane 9 superfamily member 2/4
MKSFAIVVVAFSMMLMCAHGFYIPGVATRNYMDDETVFLKVNKLVSSKTQLPYKYYDLAFCSPPEVVDMVENLGEILSGDKIENSPYEVRAGRNQQCRVLCSQLTSATDLALFAERIDEEYRVNWILDNMPAATKKTLVEANGDEQVYYEPGYPLGQRHVERVPLTAAEVEAAAASVESKKKAQVLELEVGIDGVELVPALGSDDEAGDKQTRQKQHPEREVVHFYLNNHVRIRVLFHVDPARFEGLRVVGFEVEAESIDHGEKLIDVPAASSSSTKRHRGGAHSKAAPAPATCGVPERKLEVHLNVEEQRDRVVTWTYEVEWVPSETRWAARWDVYLMMTEDQSSVHWFSIVNSMMIVLFLTGMVAMIMMRTVSADFKRYREMEDSDDPQEETGWKLVHGDVFRPPRAPMLLAVCVGSGVQVFAMTLITLVFAVLGFLSPSSRGALLTAMVVLFMLMGVFAGYYAARAYKILGGVEWRKTTALTACALPGIVFVTFLLLNACLYGEHSAGYVPLPTLLALVGLWFGVSVPLVFVGAYFGFRKPAPEPPVATNRIPRQVPAQVWYMQPAFAIVMGGVLPFGAVFIELFFILSSIWLHQFYYIFGFLAIVFVILIVTCAEITIVMCYFQLCSEDYHWWWRAFLTSGASAVYMFLYSVFYFFTKLEITKPVSILLFFGYTFIMALGFFLLTGAIGFVACYCFVTAIYGAIKVD